MKSLNPSPSLLGDTLILRSVAVEVDRSGYLVRELVLEPFPGSMACGQPPMDRRGT